MNKPVITQEQADAIGYAIERHSRVRLIDTYMKNGNGCFVEKLKQLYKMSYDDFFRCLYIGYEVEPEFKVGDWVVTKSGYVGEIEFINEFEGWANIGYSKETKERGVCLAKTFKLNEIERHATESEIAQEKERRKWEKIGRKLGEYHHYDIALDLINDVYVEVDDPDAYPGGSMRVASLDDTLDSWMVNPVNLTLVCPAENRLDTSQ